LGITTPRLLLDTHALVWWWTDDHRLPAVARAAIANEGAVVLVSAASAWEVSTKNRLGKWPDVSRIVESFEDLVRRSRFRGLAISLAHAVRAGSLGGTHRDPFDRMLIAQAQTELAVLVTGDPVFRSYNVPVIWEAALTAASP
jgi:PIN domain nuclease of toxin-antitoxin system